MLEVAKKPPCQRLLQMRELCAKSAELHTRIGALRLLGPDWRFAAVVYEECVRAMIPESGGKNHTALLPPQAEKQL